MSTPKQLLVSKRKLFLALISIALICSLASGGIMYVVAQGGSTPITISSGPYPGAPSHTIWVDSGTYYDKTSYGVTTSSTNAATIINNAVSVAGSSVYVKNSTYSITTPIIISVPNIHLYSDGATLDNGNLATSIISLVSAADETHGTQISGFVFSNFAGNAISSTVAAFPFPYDVVVEKNVFQNINSPLAKDVIDIRVTRSIVSENKIFGDGSHGGYGIVVRYANDSIIKNNFVSGTGAGVQFWRFVTSPQTTISMRNTISENTITNTWSNTDGYWAIQMIGGQSTVANNHVFNHNRDGIVISQSESESCVAVTGNTVDNTQASGIAGVGIWVHGNSATDRALSDTIIGNTVSNAAYGIVINYANYTTVTGNSIRTTNYNGIEVYGYSSIIADNVLMNTNLKGATDGGAIGVYASNCTISGNYIFGSNQTDLFIDNGGTNTFVNGLNTRDSTVACPIKLGAFLTAYRIENSYNGTQWITSSSLSPVVLPTTEKSGIASVQHQGFIAHGLVAKPTSVTLTPIYSAQYSFFGQQLITWWDQDESNSTYIKVGIAYTNGTMLTDRSVSLAWHVWYAP
jgi:parallel beta-helix repeat protein